MKLRFVDLVLKIMSDNILYILSNNPYYTAGMVTLLKCQERVTQIFPNATNLYVRNNKEIGLFCSSESLERITCPKCGKQITKEWWIAKVDQASETYFKEMNITSPCCGITVSLNDLIYLEPAGFARVCIEVFNPERYELFPSERREVENILGTKIRLVKVHM